MPAWVTRVVTGLVEFSTTAMSAPEDDVSKLPCPNRSRANRDSVPGEKCKSVLRGTHGQRRQLRGPRSKLNLTAPPAVL